MYWYCREYEFFTYQPDLMRKIGQSDNSDCGMVLTDGKYMNATKIQENVWCTSRIILEPHFVATYYWQIKVLNAPQFTFLLGTNRFYKFAWEWDDDYIQYYSLNGNLIYTKEFNADTKGRLSIKTNDIIEIYINMNKKELMVLIDGIKDVHVMLSRMDLFPASMHIFMPVHGNYEYNLLKFYKQTD